MKATFAALFAAVCMTTAGGALAASPDDIKWVNQCVADSKGMGAKEDVVLKYCICMVSKMSENETRSVTQWEKVNVTARNQCAASAGWN